MNISFYDGINDGKFFNISSGKYDDLDDIDDINVDDIDISEEIEDEEDANTCINRFVALEKDASKLHMDLNNLRNEFKGSCKDWNNLSDTVDHILNSIAELRTMMDKVNDRVNNRFKVVSEATAELADKLNLVEKKLEVFKCIDISEEECEGLKELQDETRTHLAMINKANMRLNQLGNKISDLKEFRDETYELQYGQLLDRLNLIEKKIDAFKCIDILDKVTKLEEKVEKLERGLTSNSMLIADFGRHINDTDRELSSLSDRVSKLDSKVAVTAQIVDTINGTISGYGHDYVIIADRINELESKIEKLSPVDPTPIYYDNELKYFTTPGCAKGEIHDSVNHPSHYTDGKYETIEFIEEYGMKTHIGNAIKYTSRAGKKDEDAYIEDLKKGLWYLHRHNCPPKKKHIDVLDYCKDKKLPIELTNVLIAISRENYMEAERVLRKYIEELEK